MPERTPREQMAARSRRSFLALGAGAVAAIAGWEWLGHGDDSSGVSSRFRRVLDFNERLTSKALFDPKHMAPTFEQAKAVKPRENGDEGLDDDVENANWKLSVVPYGTEKSARETRIAEIRSFAKTEHTTELKCIEGWSTVVHWGGVRLADFTSAMAPGSEKAKYVSLQTPDEGYYVGIDMPSALHPQTLLCYEMNGEPLEDEHGAPLRLVIPVKYGIKNIKRIGTIAYTDERPDDYWAERGYDYYAGM